MKRRNMSKRSSKKLFSGTAGRVHKSNLFPPVTRGGWRL
jgi:hypothetical protein